MDAPLGVPAGAAVHAEMHVLILVATDAKTPALIGVAIIAGEAAKADVPAAAVAAVLRKSFETYLTFWSKHETNE